MLNFKQAGAVALLALRLGEATPSEAKVVSPQAPSDEPAISQHSAGFALEVPAQFDALTVSDRATSSVGHSSFAQRRVTSVPPVAVETEHERARGITPSVSSSILEQSEREMRRMHQAISLLKGAGVTNVPIELGVSGKNYDLNGKVGLGAGHGVATLHANSPADAIFYRAWGKIYVDPQMLDRESNALAVMPYCIYQESLPNSQKSRVSVFSHLASKNEPLLVRDLDTSNDKSVARFAREFAKLATEQLRSGTLEQQYALIPASPAQFLIRKGPERSTSELQQLGLKSVSFEVVPPSGYHDHEHGAQLVDPKKFAESVPLISGELVQIHLVLPEVEIQAIRSDSEGTIREVNGEPLVQGIFDAFGNYVISSYQVFQGAKEGDRCRRSLLVTPRLDFSRPGEEVTLHADFSKFGMGGDVELARYRSLPRVGQLGALGVFSDLTTERRARFDAHSAEVGQAVDLMNALFAFQPGREIANLKIIGAEAPNASFSPANPKTLSFRENIFNVDSPAQVTMHEAFHLADYALGKLSDGSFKEFHDQLRMRPDGGLSFFLTLNESNFRDDIKTRFGGHSQDNPAEAFASLGVSLFHSQLMTRLQALPKNFQDDYLGALRALGRRMSELGIDQELPFNLRVRQTISELENSGFRRP
jgi:hypothetical protein